MIHRIAAAVPALLAAGLLAACGSTTDLTEKAPVETRQPVPANAAAAGATGGASTGTAPQSQVTTVDLASTAGAAAAAPRIVYFDFDSFVIKDEFKPLIESNAKALVANAGRKLTVEGHTDERGGTEYNLALGQKRAQAVVKALALLGAKEAQLEATSFGKERPADPGHDEAAWAKNRRAELKDR